MSDNPCGCVEDNCPHRTSEVNLFDGTFTNITVPASAGLNEVLALLENYITTIAVCDETSYTLDAFSACLNLPAGTYSFQQIIDAIVTRICTNAGDIETLQTAIADINAQNTTNVELDGIILPSCFSGFSGSTSTDLFNLILQNLCDLLDEVGTEVGDGPIIVIGNDPGALIPATPTGADYGKNAKVQLLAEAIKSIVDNNSFLYEHTTPVLDTTSFSIPITPMRGVVENYVIIRRDTEALSVSPTMDTYFFLNADGSILRREVAIAAPAPATPGSSHPLYKITSDGSGATALVELFTASALNPIPLAADDVATVHIQDDAVTTDKLAHVATGATAGYRSILEITFNDQGQVTAVNTDLLLSGLLDGDVLTYNSGANRFENARNTNVPVTVGALPKVNGAGDDYDTSSIVEAAAQVKSTKKIEINSGATENDASAVLNVVGGPILFPRLDATTAGALPVVDGYVVYVTTTDATFTSVGFWGMENTVWVKL